MPILKKTVLVAFEIEYNPERVDPNTTDTKGKCTLVDVATYLDGVTRVDYSDPDGREFNYNLSDVEVFPVDNCTPEIIALLRRSSDKKTAEATADDQLPLW